MSESPVQHRKRYRSMRHAIKGRIHRLVNHQLRPRNHKVHPAKTENHSQSNGDIHLPSSFSDLGDGQNWLRIGPLMLTILLIGMAWILILTHFVSKMPSDK